MSSIFSCRDEKPVWSSASDSTSPCYDLQLVAECNFPMLTHVSAAVIITMTRAKPRHQQLERSQDILKSLCPCLWIQCNAGFKNCLKSGVHHSTHDVLHAYLNVFRAMEGKGNVLILEDDVNFEFGGKDLAKHLSRVDRFLASEMGYSAYTLGSVFSLALPCGWAHHRRIVGRWAGAHAVVWSEQLREQFLKAIDIREISSDTIIHIDNTDMWPLRKKNVYTYYIPIATQTFPATDNSAVWCYKCTDMTNPRRKLYEKLYNKAARYTLHATGLDTKTQPGWNILYGVGGFGIVGNLTIVIIVIITIVVGFCIVYKTRAKYVNYSGKK